jgi:hypothetical protein
VTRDEISAFFRNDLQPDELVLWAGQPDASVHLTRADILLIPLSLWIGLSTIRSGVIILERAIESTYSAGEAILSAMLSVPFLLVGIYLLIGRFFYKRWRKTRTYYALTNKRVLVLTILACRRLLEQSLEDIPALHMTAGLLGTGTITFGRSPFASSWCTNTGMNCIAGFDKTELIAFHDVKNVDQVYWMIDALRCVYDRRCYPFSL